MWSELFPTTGSSLPVCRCLKLSLLLGSRSTWVQLLLELSWLLITSPLSVGQSMWHWRRCRLLTQREMSSFPASCSPSVRRSTAPHPSSVSSFIHHSSAGILTTTAAAATFCTQVSAAAAMHLMTPSPRRLSLILAHVGSCMPPTPRSHRRAL